MELISLPSELLQDILLLLKPAQLLTTCRSSPVIQTICQSEYFWQQKLQRDYPQTILNRKMSEGSQEYYQRIYQMPAELKLINKFFQQLEQIYQEEIDKLNKSEYNFTNLDDGFPFLEFVVKQSIAPVYQEYMIDAIPDTNRLKYILNQNVYQRPTLTIDPLFTTTVFSNWKLLFNYIYDQIINTNSQIIALAVSEVLHPQNLKRETYSDSGVMIVLDNLPLETQLDPDLQIYSENIDISQDFFFEQS